MAQEQPGRTLKHITRIHDGYVRLVGHDPRRALKNRRYFFAAAAEAMRQRRIVPQTFPILLDSPAEV
jgi:hypothetical protein